MIHSRKRTARLSSFFRSRHVAAGLVLMASMSLPAVAAALTRTPKQAGAPSPKGRQPQNIQRQTPAVQYNRDVRLILSDNCFACHGPDKNKRQANLRLDLREDAIARGAIAPGKLEKSALVARIFATGGAIMPPVASHKQLTPAQKLTLKRWVAQGAKYEGHWSFLPPQRPPVPRINDPRYPVRNAIDCFVRARLKSKGLLPSPEADRRTLIRRLYFDLLGLPPTPDEVAAFVTDPTPDAYERLVDRTLKNPHYGERMAQGWLDVVRYADTIGYHSDTGRNVWPYRDWVIRSFNENKPFDRFTLEQVAGDLLPGASQETRVGSAFNRLLLTTEEGGAQPKDYEARMLTDRVRAIGATWLGLTTGCAQCHDHKFDPFTQRDFYSLGAFFADIKEPIVGHPEPGMLVTTPEQDQELARRDAALQAAQAVVPKLKAAQAAWETGVTAQGYALPELADDSKAPEAEKKQAREVVTLLKKDAGARSQKELGTIESYFRGRVDHPFRAELATLTEAEKSRNDYYNSLPLCLVSASGPSKRTVRILPRGNWLNDSGETVKPALPAFLPQPRVEGRELNRLDLAQWLISRKNPLTPRAVMNRMWKQFFGTGLSKVLDDLGAQGESPVNPALLDWLAVDFMDSGWDVKQMVRTIVTSATYRQSSKARRDLVAADPYNRELARQSAFRLDAEEVRDNALSIAGLLVSKIGGPSVKPYQPAGYWENLNFPVREWENDRGESQYRRGLYTWWQRTFLHPSLLAFDAPTREECAAERTRSNIPQQALVLLNDPSYVEAARMFAARILREGPAPSLGSRNAECGMKKPAPQSAIQNPQSEIDGRITWAWQQTLQRTPRPEEVRTVRAVLERQLTLYRADPKAVGELLKVGYTPAPEGIDPAELAAWTHVARVLLNLHETITRS